MYRQEFYGTGSNYNLNLNDNLSSNEICRSLILFSSTTNIDYNTPEDTINDFASNGFDSFDDILSSQRIETRNGYNKYSFIEQKKNKTRKMVLQNQPFCVFCENNNEPDSVVRSHSVKDSYGRVLCPKLRIYVCPICHVSGDSAHTVKYCPQKPIITMEDTVKFESSKLTRSFFKPGMKV